MPAAHTDGDVIVHFRDADVIHMGDIYFNGMYPFIDVDFGGNLGGMIRAVEDVLDHSRENTLFIPGHGPLSDREGLRSYAEMLRTVHERVESLVVQGRTREEVVAARPTADLDPIWVRVPGSEEADFFVGLVYDGMVKQSSGG
jgi:glyoxylase-like metal-dependent hydrolase (beta-lactamase superfamily II)